MSTVAIATEVRFHVGLHTSDLRRAVDFYRVLFGVGPAKHYDDYAKFEVERPPLVLALYPSPQEAGGALNHVGLRLPDSASSSERGRWRAASASPRRGSPRSAFIDAGSGSGRSVASGP